MTTLERKRTNFEGNERVDIPDWKSMLQNAYDDFRWFLRTYIDEEARRIVKRYKEGTHSGLTFNIKLDEIRAYHDLTAEWNYKGADGVGTLKSLVLAPGTTNYVEVNILQLKDDLQPRAHWDTDLGISGEEIFDDINVRIQIMENIVSNTSGFTAGSVPLWEVETDSGNIITVTPAQDLLWKHRTISLPAVNADRDEVYDYIKDLRGYIDYLGAFFSEVKGGSQRLEEVPWSSIKLLKEYQQIIISSTGGVSWEKTTPDTLEWAADLTLKVPRRTVDYVVEADSAVLTDNDCLYVSIPEGIAPTILTPAIAQFDELPINPNDVGFDPKIYVLFLRVGAKIHGFMELPELESGEESTIGENLPTYIREGLGIKSESEFYPLTSTRVIADLDNYITKFSKLDDAIGAIYDDVHDEDEFTATEGQTVFTSTLLSWSTDNDVIDIIVFRNGRKVKQDRTGGLNKDYRKVGATSIEFAYGLRQNATVTIYRPGKSGAGIYVPLAGNIWSDPVDANILPLVNEGFDVGASGNRMRAGYFKKLVVDELQLKGTPGESKNVKLMINNTGLPIPAGTPVSKHTDGSIVPASSDTAQGQRFIGITLDAIAHTAQGRVKLVGDNIPTILTGMLFATGDEIFIDETNSYTNDVSTFSGNNDSIIKVGIADCPEGTASAVATDLIMFVEVISRPS